MRLDRSWIELNIPHHGRMCLLDEVIAWDAGHICCRSSTHRWPDHPLRSQNRLGIACGIEYAAQSMAVHGALTGGALSRGAPTPGAPTPAAPRAAPPRPAAPEIGFLAGLRDVRLHVARLDDLEAELIADAELIAGDHGSALYEFVLTSASRRLMSGRATVVFDASRRFNI
jgi:predicted hotdog family 3-hydroxylacyl-ACP dehydratase